MEPNPRTPKPPEKRKTRAWDPSPAVNLDSLPEAAQMAVNQGRPKRVKRFEGDSPNFVLDYSRSRNIARKHKGRGRPFGDDEKTARRGLRPLVRKPVPLSVVPEEKQTSGRPEKISPRKVPPPPSPPRVPPSPSPSPRVSPSASPSPSPSPPGPPGPPGGRIGRGMAVVSMAPVTSAAVSSVAASGTSVTTIPSPTSRIKPLPNIAWDVELGQGRSGWAKSLAFTRLGDADVNADEVMPMLENFAVGAYAENFRTNFLGNNAVDNLHDGRTGGVTWFLRNLENSHSNKMIYDYRPPDPGYIQRIRAARNTRKGRERFIQRAREIGEKYEWIMPGTLENGRMANVRWAAPGMKRDKTKAAIDRAASLGGRVDRIMGDYTYLLTGSRPLWTENDLRAYIRQRLQRNESILLPPASSITRPSTTVSLPTSSSTTAGVPPLKTTKLTFGAAGTAGTAVSRSVFFDSRPTTPLYSGGMFGSSGFMSPLPGEQSDTVSEYAKNVVRSITSLSSTDTEGKTQTQTTKPLNPFSATVKTPVKATFDVGGRQLRSSRPSFSSTDPLSPTLPLAGRREDVITPMVKDSIVHPVKRPSQRLSSSKAVTSKATTAATTSSIGATGNRKGRETQTTVPPPPPILHNIAFHYISDLHLEQTSYDNFDFNPTASYLILAGDIGYAHRTHQDRYRQFLARMCAKPQLRRVFLVAGNRDFWPKATNTMPEALGILRGFARHRDMKGKLTFMEDDRFEIDEKGGKIVILGCTLWTEVPGRGGGEPSDQNNRQRTARHRASCDFIRRETAKIREDPKEVATRILIITHMPPSKSGTSQPEFTTKEARDFSQGAHHGSDVINGVKAYDYDHSSVETTMPLLDVRDVWIWGHTHWNEPKAGKIRHGGMRFDCNQRGNAHGGAYNPRPEGSFQPEKVILV
ncbi:hypothetical protein SBOR_9023 [Sclerotinia borealis F-4128]|uniref:Calcineurin-like phosphoesterase domain-containing protein n=1 Tax=Sclerotinia borealis (strain F-4128) TaxID=1432307 RepID=W9C7M8_SCLBF|nr:hypothetical protein SBOR_9023 [Sclerotinia borealis F-4128]